MSDRLPEYIDPIQLADKQGIVKGHAAINSLGRLVDVLASDAGAVLVALHFRRQGRLVLIEGSLDGVLRLACQNCLAAIEWPVNHAVKLGVVTSIEQADRLPEDYEPLLLVGEKVLVRDIVEDELLLLLPAFPKHQRACAIPTKIEYPNSVAKPSGEPVRENPFSILANLKNTGDL